MQNGDYPEIRKLFDDYLRMYSSRDDSLTERFSENFTGFTGGGDFLVKDRQQWVSITRQDFSQVKDPIRIALKDVAIQSIADDVAVATGFFNIHLPIKDEILSRETARLVLIFRREADEWKIVHSSISIPYPLVREGEVYPIQELVNRNQALEQMIAERTSQLKEANESLRRKNEELAEQVAAREKVDQALQWREELQRSILEASPDDITITDREGRIRAVSPISWKMFHVEPDDKFMGLPVTDFLVPEDRERALSRLTLKLNGVNTGPSEYRALRPDGTTFDIELNSEFIRDKQGIPTGMVIIVRDITERKRAAAERERLEEQNRQLQKAESLGRMAAAIAHHFNNQLGAVFANLDLAMEELSRGVQPHASITSAMQSCMKASEVSNLMLTYLGQSFTKQERLNLCAICDRNLPILQTIVESEIRIESNLSLPGPFILADPSQIRQVLSNLVTNSREAIGEAHGTIQLSVSAIAAADIPQEHRFPSNWQPQNDAYACLEVRDTGRGIDPRNIEKIFDPFFTTKFTGRGMGLATVLGIARVHGGLIVVESPPGGGASFKVFFPME